MQCFVFVIATRQTILTQVTSKLRSTTVFTAQDEVIDRSCASFIYVYLFIEQKTFMTKTLIQIHMIVHAWNIELCDLNNVLQNKFLYETNVETVVCFSDVTGTKLVKRQYLFQVTKVCAIYCCDIKERLKKYVFIIFANFVIYHAMSENIRWVWYKI